MKTTNYVRKFYSPSFLDSVENAAYNNFDPEFSTYDPEEGFNKFDPDFYDKNKTSNMENVTPQVAYFDLTLTNTSASAKGLELFNYLRSFTKKRRTDLTGVAAPFLYIPANSMEGMSLQAGGGDGTVGFDQNGDLVIRGGTAVAPVVPADSVPGADGHVKVSCNQFPYQGLFESSATVPFRITRIRATFTSQAQIDREIVLMRRSFLGGQSQNAINPRTFFKPEQFQSLIVDIPVNWNIDAESGLELVLEPAEVLKWNVTIEQYRKLKVGALG